VLLHHVSLPVSDLERSCAFYREIVGLREIERPPFDFPGAWFAIAEDASQHLHLIGDPKNPTYRAGKALDPGDIHLAIRVESYEETLAFLRSKGYDTDADRHDDNALIADPHATAGFPQIYVFDPDRYVIELNAASLSG
jgi:glyoxylase I family protein